MSRFTHGYLRSHTRLRRAYARCSHECTRWAHGYLRIFAVVLRIFAFSTRFSRKHYGYYVIDGSHAVCRRLGYCGRPRKFSVWETIQNRSACSIKRHFNDAFFVVICRQQLKLDNMQATANILVGGRLRLSCGRSRKVYVLLAVNTVPPRSSLFP